jgi:prepilin-type N-terminal cleavage/methylation domain-containing protein
MRLDHNNKGFTLIELLVVVAIIGILSTIALAFLSGARDRGKDAAIKQQLNSLKTEIELNYGLAGVYGGSACGGSTSIGGRCDLGTCVASGALFNSSANPKIAQLMSGVLQAAGGGASSFCKVNTGMTEWAVAVVLPSTVDSVSGSASTWCVDSTNRSTEIPAQSGSFVPPFTNGSGSARCI